MLPRASSVSPSASIKHPTKMHVSVDTRRGVIGFDHCGTFTLPPGSRTGDAGLGLLLVPLPLGVTPGEGRDLADAGAHLVARILGRQLGGTLREDVRTRRSRRFDRDARQVAVDVAIDGRLAGPNKAAIDCRLTLGVDDLASMVVETSRSRQIVLANRGLDRAGIEVAQAAADTRVGLSRVPAATLASSTSTVARCANRPSVPAARSSRVSIKGFRMAR